MLEHETQSACWLMLSGVAVMVKVRLAGVVASADVDDGDTGLAELFICGIPSNHRNAVRGDEYANRE